MNVAGMVIADRYRLEALLGRGGMGEVWRAFDARLERRVAVKFLPAQMARDGERLNRFLREARVTARLQHPGITQVFDRGEQHGQLHLVMELLDGRDLASVLREHPSGLPVDRAAELTAQVAEALSYAHRADVVHRDVKPANLMLLGDGRVKVCDFGIAGFVQADSGLTREGTAIGTADYMAPEQCLGHRVDGRADLYALGCVLFALLTGSPPFSGAAESLVIMMNHVHTPPRRVAELRPGIPEEIDELASSLLTKDPASRPSDGKDIADRLRSLGHAPGDTPRHTRGRDGSGTGPVAPPEPALSVAAAGIALETYLNEYLAPESTEVDVILTVTSTEPGLDDTSAMAPRALVFLVGLSGGMPEADFRAVTAAVGTAIDALDEGASFAVVAGSEYATMLYPDSLRLASANPVTKAQARAALAGLAPAGSAAFGRWMRLADRLFAGHSGAVRTAVLLTDMVAEAEGPDELAAALASCAGRFVCHARGIGTDWEVGQLRSIAAALNGTDDLVMAPAETLEQDLAVILARTRTSFVRDLALRITTPDGARVRFVKQVAPSVEDLTGRRYSTGAGVGEYPVDVKGNESCDYHLSLEVAPGRPGDEVIAAEVGIVMLPPAGDGQTLAQERVRVQWADDNAIADEPRR
ncbi:serine/threonine-protein kinase [Streptomyces lavendulae]|uniref:serine/threonine-protein kinase n=1 Tax=Streptomyces lavendulae TaxID=1914 RepID=UPI0033CF164C